MSPLLAFLLLSQPTEWLEVQSFVVLPDGGTSVAVATPFRLVIEARHSKGNIALLPENLNLGEHFAERKARRQHQRLLSDAAEVDRYELELLAFTAGDLALPQIPLALGSTTASTEALRILVDTTFSEAELPVATSTLAEAAAELEKMAAQNPPPESISVADWTLAWIGGIVSLMALMAWWVWRYRRAQRMKPVPPPPPPPPRPAHEIALEALTALKAKGIQVATLKAFYVELSAIVRAYAGGRYGFESLELTVDELLEALRTQPRPGLDYQVLQQLLDGADWVKFAKYQATEIEAQEALRLAFGIVESTRPREDAP